MTRLILSLLLLASLTARAATGDILSVSVETNGWIARVKISGLTTGGTYADRMGLATNWNPTGTGPSPKLVLAVTSVGFSDSGTATTIARTLYGTKQVRAQYPTNDITPANVFAETQDGSDVIVRVALSDYVYPDCTATATVGAGLYTRSGTPNNAASGVSVGNASTLGHAKTVGNWTWPPRERISGNSFVLRAVAFHRSGQTGRPVRAMRFWASDEHGLSNTVWVTKPTIDWSLSDSAPVQEYTATMDASGLTQGDEITCNFVAYPWLGDSSSKLDTADGVNAALPGYSPIKLLCDRTGAYGRSFALVGTGGSDATGVAVTNGSPSVKFATINGALGAIRGTNNALFSRNDLGASVVFLEAGSYAWTGGSSTYGATPESWLTITPASGVSRASVTINSASGDADASDMVCWSNLTVSLSSSTVTGCEDFWLDRCAITTTRSSFPIINRLYVTRSTISQWTDGIRGSGGVLHPVLIRGNDLSGLGGISYPYVAIGNKRNATSSTVFSWKAHDDADASTRSYQLRNTVWAFNNMLDCDNDTAALGGPATFDGQHDSNTNLHGAAIVGNLWEFSCGGTPYAGFWWAGDSSIGDVNHVIIWNNTIVGQRMNCAYNDVAGGPYWRRNWSMRNNYMSKHATKHDDFANSTGNYGGWAVLYGVGASGNIYAETQGQAGTGSFLSEVPGLCSYPQPVTYGPNGNWMAALSMMAYDTTGTVTGAAGGGNYRVTTASPLYWCVSGDWPLAFDVFGSPRSALDVPGAFSGTWWHVATTGSDSNTGQTNSPFLTIQKGIDMAYGNDTVCVGDGTYEPGARWDTGRSGTASARVTIKSGNRWGAIDTRGGYIDQDYITVDGFTIQGINTTPSQGAIRFAYTADYGWILNCKFKDLTVTGRRGVDMDNGGDLPTQSCQSCIISNNVFLNVAGNVISTFGSGHTVTRNWVSTTGADLFRVAGANQTFSYNYSEGLGSLEGGGHADIFQAVAQNNDTTTNIVLEGNFFNGGDDAQVCQIEGSSDGVLVDIGDITFRNNVYFKIAGYGSVMAPRVKFHNNTFFLCAWNVRRVIDFAYLSDEVDPTARDGDAHSGQCVNNAFVGCGGDVSTYPYHSVSNWPTGGFYNFDGALTNTVKDYNYVASADFTSKSDFSETHGVNGGDPKWSLIARTDFSPGAGSVLIGAGTNGTGLGFTTDFRGYRRGYYHVSAWTIGAVELPAVELKTIPAGWYYRGNSVGFTDLTAFAYATPAYDVYEDAFYVETHELPNWLAADLVQYALDNSEATVDNPVTNPLLKTPGGTTLLALYNSNEAYERNHDGYLYWDAVDSKVRVRMGYEKWPVMGLNWYGALALCNWRSEDDGLQAMYSLTTWARTTGTNGWRLPTESEHEKAMRGGLVTNHFPWASVSASYASDISTNRAQYRASGETTHVWDTSPVGSYPAGTNGFGLFDMAGNMIEPCYDVLTTTYSGAGTNNPSSSPPGTYVPWHGGTFDDSDGHCVNWWRGEQQTEYMPATTAWYHTVRMVRDYTTAGTGGGEAVRNQSIGVPELFIQRWNQ